MTEQEQENLQEQEQAVETVPAPQKKRRWLIPVIIGGGAALLAVVIALTWEVFGSRIWNKITESNDYEFVENLKEPTCTEDGVALYRNSRGQEKEVVIPALGHTVQYCPEVAATCTTEGNTEYWTCVTCERYFSDADGKNQILSAATKVSALGHNYVDGVCIRCGEAEPEYGEKTEEGLLISEPDKTLLKVGQGSVLTGEEDIWAIADNAQLALTVTVLPRSLKKIGKAAISSKYTTIIYMGIEEEWEQVEKAEEWNLSGEEVVINPLKVQFVDSETGAATYNEQWAASYGETETKEDGVYVSSYLDCPKYVYLTGNGKIGANAFGQALEQLIIISTHEEIQADAFSLCSNLMNIRFNVEVESYYQNRERYPGLTEVIDKVTFNNGTFAWGEDLGGYRFAYRLEQGEAFILGYEGTLPENLTIPEEEAGCKVAYIERNAFYHTDALKTVALPSGLKEIWYMAFAGCTNLESIAFPESVTYVSPSAFRDDTECVFSYAGTVCPYTPEDLSVWQSFNYDGYEFRSNGDGTCALTRVPCESSEFCVPELSDKGETVTAVYAIAFDAQNIGAKVYGIFAEKVTLPESVAEQYGELTQGVVYAGTQKEWSSVIQGASWLCGYQHTESAHPRFLSVECRDGKMTYMNEMDSRKAWTDEGFVTVYFVKNYY